ncbi:MAG: amino acid ABC transporter permease [Lachnospiraceae bacterium]|nr:amino acid ABC transporter permease [Lachnospiraceae bacterium]
MNTYTRTVRDALYEEPGKKAKKQIAVATAISLVAIAVFIFFIAKAFYDNGQFDAKYWSFFTKYTTWRFIANGLVGTLEAAFLAGLMAFIIGMIFMIGRICNYKILNRIATVLIEFTRGVPTLLFIYFFFLIVPQLGINLPSIFRISIPVAISACGVVAEVLRSGVNAVPKGQKEAALSLGMTESKTFTKIIFPQAIHQVIPALIAEIVIVVKDTTFAYVINFPDLMQNAKVLISNYDALLSVYLVVAVIYIIINYILNKISVAIARRTQTSPVITR